MFCICIFTEQKTIIVNMFKMLHKFNKDVTKSEQNKKVFVKSGFTNAFLFYIIRLSL